MNYPSTYQPAWHRLVACLLLLVLPAYAFASSSLPVSTHDEPADNVIKAVVVEVNPYEANRVLASKTGSDASADARHLLLPFDLPGESFTPVRLFRSYHSGERLTSCRVCRSGKTSLQLFYCVLLI